MKNSVSDHSFYIESDEEEVEVEKEFDKAEENNDGNASDSSDSSADHQQQIKPGSYNTSWPQSYRFLVSLSLSFSVPLCLVSWISFSCLSIGFRCDCYVIKVVSVDPIGSEIDPIKPYQQW